MAGPGSCRICGAESAAQCDIACGGMASADGRREHARQGGGADEARRAWSCPHSTHAIACDAARVGGGAPRKEAQAVLLRLGWFAGEATQKWRTSDDRFLRRRVDGTDAAAVAAAAAGAADAVRDRSDVVAGGGDRGGAVGQGGDAPGRKRRGRHPAGDGGGALFPDACSDGGAEGAAAAERALRPRRAASGAAVCDGAARLRLRCRCRWVRCTTSTRTPTSTHTSTTIHTTTSCSSGGGDPPRRPAASRGRPLRGCQRRGDRSRHARRRAVTDGPALALRLVAD